MFLVSSRTDIRVPLPTGQCSSSIGFEINFLDCLGSPRHNLDLSVGDLVSGLLHLVKNVSVLHELSNGSNRTLNGIWLKAYLLWSYACPQKMPLSNGVWGYAMLRAVRPERVQTGSSNFVNRSHTTARRDASTFQTNEHGTINSNSRVPPSMPGHAPSFALGTRVASSSSQHHIAFTNLNLTEPTGGAISRVRDPYGTWKARTGVANFVRNLDELSAFGGRESDSSDAPQCTPGRGLDTKSFNTIINIRVEAVVIFHLVHPLRIVFNSTIYLISADLNYSDMILTASEPSTFADYGKLYSRNTSHPVAGIMLHEGYISLVDLNRNFLSIEDLDGKTWHVHSPHVAIRAGLTKLRTFVIFDTAPEISRNPIAFNVRAPRGVVTAIEGAGARVLIRDFQGKLWECADPSQLVKNGLAINTFVNFDENNPMDASEGEGSGYRPIVIRLQERGDETRGTAYSVRRA
ncbi:hypothetical protein BD410DRAFT_800348 [Rickenella mellea]|uniref:Uncharacterized protein n=1 Tax=Rickenella mellea TaxID=50990 RepID=A0A4Y7QFQ4_9AGAM|nr:hypothetical protein BD410DRAFT_800348 [Rickenella mellea]